MLQFFSASTSVVNSKRAITKCLENALEGEPNLDCDLIIIYSAIGHNFKDLLTEARKLSPNARIVGCTGAGIIGKNGPDESMKALAIMAITGPKNEFAVAGRSTRIDTDPYLICADMAKELKSNNPDINMIHFLPSGFLMPTDRGIEAIKSVFGTGIPIFGGISMDNSKGINCYSFFDDQVIERGIVMVGFADPTLKFISKVNHGFNIIEGTPFEVTRAVSGRIFELNGRPAWKVITETLGLPETTKAIEVTPIAGFAWELPEKYQEEYASKYLLFVSMTNNDDDSFNAAITCKDGMNIWLTRRDEKKMFEGVDLIVKIILDELKGKKPLAVFHADCVLRGKLSLTRILKDEIISRMQTPIFGGDNIPWLGMYSAGEFAMLGGQTWVHQMSSSLFVLYRENN